MEEQKKTQGEAGGDSLFDGGFDTAVPERPWATLKRLWHTAQDQHLRLLVVVLSVVCYTALAIAAPYYSAGIVDLLWENIQRAQGLGGLCGHLAAGGTGDLCAPAPLPGLLGVLHLAVLPHGGLCRAAEPPAAPGDE